jgi:hypothetical protein
LAFTDRPGSVLKSESCLPPPDNSRSEGGLKVSNFQSPRGKAWLKVCLGNVVIMDPLGCTPKR